DESFRMCIDYHKLSKIYLYSGCHQMRVHKDEIPKTEFRTHYGHFELTVYTKSKEEYESHLKMNLELLKKEICHVKPNKANKVVDAWSRKGGVKPRQVQDICRMIQAEISKKMLVILMVGDVRTLIMKEAHAMKYYVHPGVKEEVARHEVHVLSIPDRDGIACVRNLVVVGILTFREMSFPTKIVIIRVFDVFSLEALYGRKCRSLVLWAKIGESSLIGPELVLETTDKVILIKEKLKMMSDR
nr:reverse transcriptase domain-containing protein [Tanacetum cinerariifolium]